MEVKKWEKKVKLSEEKVEGQLKELKEKEQENRINKLKIKEMKRLIKHNQLKPIGGATSHVLALPNSHQMTMDHKVDDENTINGASHQLSARRTGEKLGNLNDNTFLTGGGEDEI